VREGKGKRRGPRIHKLTEGRRVNKRKDQSRESSEREAGTGTKKNLSRSEAEKEGHATGATIPKKGERTALKGKKINDGAETQSSQWAGFRSDTRRRNWKKVRGNTRTCGGRKQGDDGNK